jgi:hypothetical protein
MVRRMLRISIAEQGGDEPARFDMLTSIGINKHKIFAGPACARAVS